MEPVRINGTGASQAKVEATKERKPTVLLQIELNG